MMRLEIVAGRSEARVVVAEGRRAIAEKSFPSDRFLSRELLIAINTLLKEQHIEPSVIKEVAVEEDAASFSAARTARITAEMLREAWAL